MHRSIYLLKILLKEISFSRTEKDKEALKRDADDARAAMDSLVRDKVTIS